VGVGDSQLEAAFALRGPIPAGSWNLVGDGLVLEPVDVHFEVIWRAGQTDQTLVSFDHHFDPQPSGFNAVAFDGTATGLAASAHAGDELVLRFTASNTTAQTAYLPNGDGASANGRIPSIQLPH
jgi:hypothetical protein